VNKLLQLSEVVAGYATPVVGPCSMTMEAGDRIGLAGPNGAGKSTLLRAIADSARVFSGRIERRQALQLAWQEQQPVRPDELPVSGWDYLRFAGATERPPPARLAEWLGKRADSLSGGQFQLLSIWAALGGKAQLVLLDEPTNNLDPLGEQILADTLSLDTTERAVLIVCHDRAFLERTCNRIMEIGT
jgi:ATPase subunit of ABC transporter with duplicated ATPase domains